MQRIVPALLITAGTIVLQYHSILFWSGHVNPEIGWLWSLVIEAAGLWMWYRRDLSGRMIGLLASMLLLAGPLYQIGLPALEKSAQAATEQVAYEQKVREMRNQIEQDAQLLLTFSSNSAKRTGWLTPMQDTQKRLASARSELVSTLANQPRTIQSNGFAVFGVMILQALALILVQVSNVLAIGHLAKLRMAVHSRVQTSSKAVAESDNQEAGDQLIELREQVKMFIDQYALSISAAADRLDIDRHNLTYLLKFKRASDRKPAAHVIEQLASRFAV